MAAPTRAQFHAYGLPASACTPEVRSLASVDVMASTFELAGHGFIDGNVIRFKADGAGASLDSALSPSVRYKVLTNGDSLFSVTTLADVDVVLVGDAIGVICVVEDFAAKIDTILAARWSYALNKCKAYRPPFVTPPEELVMVVCHLAALDVAIMLRASSPAYSIDDLTKRATAADIFLSEKNKGDTFATDPADATPVLAEAGARSWKLASRGWDAPEMNGELT
ncbi:MAG: hypothetical protein ABJE95_19645 [Byssovorax sp.]